MNTANMTREYMGRGLPVSALTILVPLLIAALWVAAGPFWAIAALLGAVLLGSGLSSYAWTLTIVLVGRTCLDFFYDQTMYLGSVKISAASVFSLVILGLILSVLLAARSSIPRSEGVKAFGLLMLGCLIGTIVAYVRFGEEGNVALRELVRLFVLLVWYVFLYDRFRVSGDARPFLRAVIVASLLPIGVAFWHLSSGVGVSTGELNRIHSTFVEPNAFGFYLVFLAMFCCARVAQGGRWTSWILLFLALFFLYHTYSRGAWITMMIAAPLFWLRVARRRPLVVVGLILVFLAVYPLLSARLSSIDYTDILVESSTGVTSNSYSFRVLIWSRLLSKWIQHPLVGWGLETTEIINPIRAYQDGKGAAAHNDAVRFLVETGLVGFAFYLFFLWFLGRDLYRRWRQLTGHPLRVYATAGLCIYVAFLVQSFTVSEPLHQTIFLFHLFGLAAVMAGCGDFLAARALETNGGQGTP